MLFARLVPEFETLSPGIDEQAIRSEDYALLPLLLARAKADALLNHVPQDAILVTCDQVVVCNGDLREKPSSVAEARRWLNTISDHPSQTNTAIVVHNVSTGARHEGVDIARVYFRPLPAAAIAQLIEEGRIFAAAGGFLIEDPRFAASVARIEGETESVMGLPIELTARLLCLAAGRAIES